MQDDSPFSGYNTSGHFDEVAWRSYWDAIYAERDARLPTYIREAIGR
jgi:hypothetical protein